MPLPIFGSRDVMHKEECCGGSGVRPACDVRPDGPLPTASIELLIQDFNYHVQFKRWNDTFTAVPFKPK
jgi:hypothetical protein